MLFRTSLATDQHREIVQYFEIIKEMYPDVELDFDAIMKVATAYQELGEYERSYLVFRATIENSFERKNQIAAFLTGQNEFVRSVEVVERCGDFAKRYPESDLLDSFWYLIGYSQFALGEHEAALTMCRKVSETKRKDKRTGTEIEAANKWQAIYIMGQIYHSLGKPSEAIAEYERVKERFSDATEAIDFFTRKDIALPEVTTVKPGDAGEVELSYRNVKEASVKVYRIDLLKFGLMQRNLDKVTAINLAGIRPYHEMKTELGDGNDFKDRTKDLKLPLKEEGAYLVVCRGENLYASGLVLVSPLQLEVQEDSTSGRVRVAVKDSVKDSYLRNVLVKVIGSANDDFNTGETDLRGIFFADAIRGTSTIIARADQDRYAFYRGTQSLGTVAQPQSEREAIPSAPEDMNGNGQQDLLQNLFDTNGEIQGTNRGNYRTLLNNGTKGVKAKAAF